MIRIFCLLLILLCAIPVSGQVNMEKARRGLETSGFSGDIGLTYALTLGNSELYLLGLSPNIVWRHRRHQIFTINELQRVSTDDGAIINKGFSHLRYNFDLGRLPVYEAFAQAQYDKSRDLTARYLAGTGLRLRIVQRESTTFAIGIAGIYEYEELSSGEITKLIRASDYLSFRLRSGDRLTISGTAYLQPAFSDFDDIRILLEANLAFGITGDLSFTHTLGYRYDSLPPPDIKEYDLSIKNGLSFMF